MNNTRSHCSCASRQNPVQNNTKRLGGHDAHLPSITYYYDFGNIAAVFHDDDHLMIIHSNFPLSLLHALASELKKRHSRAWARAICVTTVTWLVRVNA